MHRPYRAWPTAHAALALVALAALSCNEATRPAPPAFDDLTVSPQRILSGAEIEISSRSFADLVALPAHDSAGREIPNRWSNLTVTIEGDTAESWRPDLITIAVDPGPLLSGRHDVKLDFAGYHLSVSIEVVGARTRSYWPDLRWPADIVESFPVGPGRVVTFSPYWNGAVLIDLQSGRVESDTRTRDRGSGPWSRTPGASYRPGHAVLNLRHPAEPPRVWRLHPAIEPLDTVACYDRAASSLEIAEIGPGRCLAIFNTAGGYSIRANGTNQITPSDEFLRDAFFVVAPGGRWTVPVTREFEGIDRRIGLAEWFIFDQTPSISFRTRRYSQVTGAAFTAAGDTLFVVADIVRGALTDSWVLDALDPSTGDPYWSLALGTGERFELVFMAAYADPLKPYVYVAQSQDNDSSGRLWIIDRPTGRVIGRMETPVMGFRYTVSGALVHGGSSGALYFFGWCGWDCDMNITPFDLDFNLFESLAGRIP